MNLYKEIAENKTKKEIAAYFLMVLAFLAVGYMTYAQTTTKEKDNSSKKNKLQKVSLLNLNNKKKESSYIKTDGKVESKQSIDIKSEITGKIRSVYVDLGDQVYSNQTLAIFENGDEYSRLQQARADLNSALAKKEELQSALESQKSKLRKLKTSPRSEELQQARTKVSNAEKSLVSAKENRKKTKKENRQNLNSTLTDSLSSAQIAANKAKDIILTVTEVQYDHFRKEDQSSSRISSAKAQAVESLLGQSDAGGWIKKHLSTLEGGVFAEVENAIQVKSLSNTKQALDSTILALKDVKRLLEVIPYNSNLTSSDEDNINSAKQSIRQQLELLRSKKQSIETQISKNESALQQAKSKLTEAKNSLDSAKDNLSIVKSGADEEDVKSQKEAVKQARANLKIQQAKVDSARAQITSAESTLSKTVIRSPINGTVSKIDVNRGDLVSNSQLIARVVNTDGYQVKSYVSAKEIKNIEVGNTTTIAGEFTGQVTNISPSLDPETNKVEVIISVPEGSSLVAGNYVDVKIKKTTQKNSYILLPIESVALTNEGSFVYTVNKDNEIEKNGVIVGSIVGGKIEVKSGLEDIANIIKSTRGLEPKQEVTIN